MALDCDVDERFHQSTADSAAPMLFQYRHAADLRIRGVEDDTSSTDRLAADVGQDVDGAVVVGVELLLGGHTLLILEDTTTDVESLRAFFQAGDDANVNCA